MFSYNNAAKELRESVGIALIALRESRAASLQSYLNSIEQDLDVVSSSREIREALNGFSLAYAQVGTKQLREAYIGQTGDDNKQAGIGAYQNAHEKFHPWSRTSSKPSPANRSGPKASRAKSHLIS